MRLTSAIFTIASALVMACSQVEAAPVVAGYLLLNPTNGPAKLKALADNAAKLPINRIFLSFARPGMVYVPGSNTLEHVGLNYANTPDYGFADLKDKVTKLQAGGVEVFLSVGGWNYGCFPYVYTYYSVGGYGTSTPNYYKIKEHGGTLAGCTEANMWCYTCEPKSENTVLADFDIFPEPSNSSTWQEAQKYVIAQAGGEAPVFHPEMIPGHSWTDPITKITNLVPGSDYFVKTNRDPYQDLVYLGKDLGLAGVDIDYEEMWHADFYKKGASTGPWTSHQTVYKYAAIMRDVQINIQAIQPSMMLATAASAAGGLSTNWWGGNLKNIWYNVNKWYPEVYSFMATGKNGGGVNVMTYDLSNNQEYHECPDTGVCSLSQQVNYYMKSYADNGMIAHVGYEIGIPAYPASDHDPTHQLPLTQSELSSILAVQGSKGGFFWELYKKAGSTNNVDATSAAQQICKAALGANTPRCSGVIPQIDGTSPSTTTASSTVTSTSSAPVTSTTLPSNTCSVAAWSATATYNANAQVSYNGRLYTAKWWSQNNIPTAGGPWVDNGPCGSSTANPTTAPTATATPGGCSGVSAFSASTAYTSGSKVSYNGFVYTAQWWTQGETPGSSAVWVKGAACSATLRRRLY
ncbi:hypothetical protein BX616_000641 [Lobosporangium transversale]|uniref:Chitin-binding type-3 domain-containing protein n=1 Tax=Lobosporangium transversale TaxID=64571 RepID=A0A1Y2GNU2_9FUNG|nr:hypothetical protein BCR41DRAFT_396371 [Lobosporangium transversale]KAF9906719.1 hypothetical protein BX616_000641 [Lobosporangium transversale]ORZ15421.1 hypothetical protein BCR41DRAFT_396371 [Lobosporangium transversale]|eukprot:XP_021881169.1 hypothetical protein BCR41DRAFT_396371 [Lobosporangium transversale]